MFKIYRRETAAPELDLLTPTLPQCLSTEASLTRKACLGTNELFRATHNTVTVLDSSIHWASPPRMKARAEPIFALSECGSSEEAEVIFRSAADKQVQGFYSIRFGETRQGWMAGSRRTSPLHPPKNGTAEAVLRRSAIAVLDQPALFFCSCRDPRSSCVWFRALQYG
jgi:hypothetical protein